MDATQQHADAPAVKTLDDLRERIDPRRIHEWHTAQADDHSLHTEMRAFQRPLELDRKSVV